MSSSAPARHACRRGSREEGGEGGMVLGQPPQCRASARAALLASQPPLRGSHYLHFTHEEMEAQQDGAISLKSHDQ